MGDPAPTAPTPAPFDASIAQASFGIVEAQITIPLDVSATSR
jgi:hypothetical protein